MTWRFKGARGEFLPGVPARDLTDKEAKGYGVEASALYERAPVRAEAVKPEKESADGN